MIIRKSDNNKMKVYINDVAKELPNFIKNIEELLEYIHVKRGGTAVAVNNKLIVSNHWEKHQLKDGDRITVISATFGG